MVASGLPKAIQPESVMTRPEVWLRLMGWRYFVAAV